MSSVLVISAHPDDETLGSAGTLLRHRAEGDEVHWCVATVAWEPRWEASIVKAKADEVDAVAKAYGFGSVTRLGHQATRLDTVAGDQLVGEIRDVVRTTRASTVYCVSPSDIHGDHRVLFLAAAAAVKSFRADVRRFLAYETLSSTDAAIGSAEQPFTPTVFVDIGPYLRRKLEILSLYRTEIGDAPFPRSAESVSALARVRGATLGVEYAEAFQLIRERR